METTELRELTRRIREFAQARDWEQFHTPKNLAMALSAEVAELAEHVQWATPEEAQRLAGDPDARPDLADEVADVAIYLLRLADVLDLWRRPSATSSRRASAGSRPSACGGGRPFRPASGLNDPRGGFTGPSPPTRPSHPTCGVFPLGVSVSL